MGRKYRRKLGARKYKDYSEETLLTAITACKNGMSSRTAEKKFKIPRRTLLNKLNSVHMKKVGHPTALQKDKEEAIVRHLLVCSEWGMPLSSMDVR